MEIYEYIYILLRFWVAAEEVAISFYVLNSFVLETGTSYGTGSAVCGIIGISDL